MCEILDSRDPPNTSTEGWADESVTFSVQTCFTYLIFDSLSTSDHLMSHDLNATTELQSQRVEGKQKLKKKKKIRNGKKYIFSLEMRITLPD